ncbi:MAG: hypothetical protein ABSG14_11450 [Verrucomicrobiia bacterium]
MPEISTELKAATAKLEAGKQGGVCLVKVGGDWRLNEPVPSWTGVLGERTATSVRVVPEDLGKWDTLLVLFLVHGQGWCVEKKIDFKVEALPANLQTLLRQVTEMGAPKSMAKRLLSRAWHWQKSWRRNGHAMPRGGPLSSLRSACWSLSTRRLFRRGCQ